MTEDQFQKQLTELETKYSGKTVIADFYQLGRTTGNKFDRETKKPIRSNTPVEMSHVAAINGQWANCGKLYVVNEEKTAEWQEKLADHKETLAKREKAEKIGAKKLSAALADIGKEDEETEGFKTRKAKREKAEKTFVVNLELEIGEVAGEVNKEDFLFTGTEVECKAFVKTEKKKK